jgi:hypothetical protein
VEHIPYARCLPCQTFATFSVVVQVKGHQERSSSSTEIHLFLKCLKHSYVCVWPRALSPNASLSILCVYEAVLLSLKENLMQILCSFTSFILAGWYDRKTALTHHHKNAHKKHTRPHSRTPLGRVVHKGYSSWYLAAHNCTTSGFHAAFIFRGLLGSTTYEGWFLKEWQESTLYPNDPIE